MIRMIMEHVQNRSFTTTSGESKQNRLRRLRNGLPQGSVVAPLLFNIYTYDLLSLKYAYADDLALLYASLDWKAVEITLSQDITTLEYTFKLSPDSENEAQQYENGDGGFSS